MKFNYLTEGALSKILAGAAIGGTALGFHDMSNINDHISNSDLLDPQNSYNSMVDTLNAGIKGAGTGALVGGAAGLGLHSILNNNSNNSNNFNNSRLNNSRLNTSTRFTRR